MCCNEFNDCNCLNETLCAIVALQKKGQCHSKALLSCDRPFLGKNNLTSNFNTRPITLYNCNANLLWSMPYTSNQTVRTSSVFRLENVDGCCATFRVLAPNHEPNHEFPYVATESFFIINLNCLGAIKCLPDTFVSCI